MARLPVEELRLKGKDRRLTWQEVDALCDRVLELESCLNRILRGHNDDCVLCARKDTEARRGLGKATKEEVDATVETS